MWLNQLLQDPFPSPFTELKYHPIIRLIENGIKYPRDEDIYEFPSVTITEVAEESSECESEKEMAETYDEVISVVNFIRI